MEYIKLKEFCQRTGLSEGSIRQLIFYDHRTGIVASGALYRLGRNWYVDETKLKEYMLDRARRWADTQAERSARTKSPFKKDHAENQTQP